MQYTGVIDLFEKAWELSLEQYRESPNLKALIKAIIDNGQPFENACGRFMEWADIDAAEGAWLDIIGKIRNLPRDPGESDKDYRDRLKEQIKTDNAGTPDNVIDNAHDISGDDSPQYMDEVPATFFVYTPGGRQIRRARLQRLAPAGVLALPGAAIDAGGGNRKRLATAGGKIILVAAPEAVSMRLTAETGERIADENGNTLRTEGT